MAARGARRRVDEGEHRYNLRSYDRGRDEGYERGARTTKRDTGRRRYASPPPPSSSTRYRASLMRDQGAGRKRRRDELDDLSDYEAHPLDSFDRYMLAKMDRDNAPRRREHIRPAREVERLAQRGRPELKRRTDYDEYSEEDEDAYRYGKRGSYSRDELRGRQMSRRRDEAEHHVRFAGYDDQYGEDQDEEDQGYSDEGESIMSAPEELDEDEEFLTNYRMPIRRRAAYYHDGRGREKRHRRDEAESDQSDEDQGLVFTVDEEDQDEGIGGRVARRYAREHGIDASEVPATKRERKTHRHPKYEDMIGTTLPAGKNGKASGVAIFKYIHDHFDMPANDRLVRNHLHQAFEKMIDEGRLRHKKASYVVPQKLLTELTSKYSQAEDTEKDTEEPKETEGSKETEKNEEDKQAGGGDEQKQKGTEEAPAQTDTAKDKADSPKKKKKSQKNK